MWSGSDPCTIFFFQEKIGKTCLPAQKATNISLSLSDCCFCIDLYIHIPWEHGDEMEWGREETKQEGGGGRVWGDLTSSSELYPVQIPIYIFFCDCGPGIYLYPFCYCYIVLLFRIQWHSTIIKCYIMGDPRYLPSYDFWFIHQSPVQWVPDYWCDLTYVHIASSSQYLFIAFIDLSIPFVFLRRTIIKIALIATLFCMIP